MLFQAAEFRDLYGMAIQGAWEELTKPVDQLAGGEPYRLHGFDLPEDHPALAEYGPNADLVLTADDRLVLFEEFVAGELAAVSERS